MLSIILQNIACFFKHDFRFTPNIYHRKCKRCGLKQKRFKWDMYRWVPDKPPYQYKPVNDPIDWEDQID